MLFSQFSGLKIIHSKVKVYIFAFIFVAILTQKLIYAINI